MRTVAACLPAHSRCHRRRAQEGAQRTQVKALRVAIKNADRGAAGAAATAATMRDAALAEFEYFVDSSSAGGWKQLTAPQKATLVEDLLDAVQA